MLDSLILQIRPGFAHCFCQSADRCDPMPGETLPEAEMTEAERSHVAALMRINHVGEVCAQALYAGQAFTARETRSTAGAGTGRLGGNRASQLDRTAHRRNSAGARACLIPLWYAGAWTIGAVAGALGRPGQPGVSRRNRAPGRGASGWPHEPVAGRRSAFAGHHRPDEGRRNRPCPDRGAVLAPPSCRGLPKAR